MNCPHARVERWRRQRYDPPAHGPETTRTVAGETLYRSWTNCLDCGVRLERALLMKSAGHNSAQSAKSYDSATKGKNR